MWVKPSLIFEVEDSNPPKILAMSSIKDFWTPDTLRGLSEAIAENDLKIKIDTSFDRWLNHNQRTGFKRYELGIWGWRWYRK
ncbi:MAG: hypothetical protein EHM20_16545 [Alphaproteobacteria bacterium]|nr:MAG: hypothetical protein EHM20_16545 [Alphaproteobacteria bacterium]